MILASRNRRSKDVPIEPIIVPELKLSDIQWHIFAADLMKATDDAALNDGPEAFDRLGVDCTDDILLFCMVNNGVRIFLAQMLIAYPLVGAKQADLVRDGLMHECFKSSGAHIIDDTSDYIALAPDSANNRDFTRANAAGTATSTTLVLVAVFSQTTDESFINLNDAAKFFRIFDKCNADFMAHHPSGFIGAEAHIAHDLQGTHAFLAGQHEVSNAKPVTEWLVRIFEDRSSNMGKPIACRAAWGALSTLPMPLSGRQIIHSGITAARAANTLWPSSGNEVGSTGIFVGEHFLELSGCQLGDRLGLLPIHSHIPPIEEYCHV